MAFRGALLKPSEKNNKPVARSSQRVAKQSRYEVLKDKIRTWWEDRLKVGAALREIRDEKLYKHEHETFEEFCQSEYGFERAHAYRLIGFAEVKETVKMSPIGDKIVRESQARALAPIPVDQREEVIEKAAEKGPITAKAITEAAQEVVKPEPPKAQAKEEQHFDKTGYPIPDAILADWKRAEAFGANLREISRIKGELSKGLEDKDPIFIRELNSSAVSMLQNLYAELKGIIPYAVCTSCQGKQKTKCSLCKGSGFISQFAFNQFVPAETKELRKKVVHK